MSKGDEPLFARLLCDVMIPAELSAAIRAQGYDVLEARTLPADIQQDDWAILAEAARQHRAVVTCNYSDPQSNFCLIHEEWQAKRKEHAGIIQCDIGDNHSWDSRASPPTQARMPSSCNEDRACGDADRSDRQIGRAHV